MINTEAGLKKVLANLKGTPWIAVDTEADSLHAYPEKLCLVQIAHASGEELIDPLSGIDLKAFWNELQRHELIFHAADYDLRLLSRLQGFVPSSIFDTMLAARLLGEHEFGLNNLLNRYLTISLEKGSQKANWARRPLTPKMADYAINDVKFLKQLSDILRAELRAKGRLTWHRQLCENLIREAAEERKADPNVIWRIKGSQNLSPLGLAILRELWHWREKAALAANKPPYFIIKHETLVQMAEDAAEGRNYEKLLPRFLSDRRRIDIRKAISDALDVPEEERPVRLQNPTRRGSEEEKRRFRELEKKRNQIAHELKIDPTLIANRSTLSALAQDFEGNLPLLLDWQRELLET